MIHFFKFLKHPCIFKCNKTRKCFFMQIHFSFALNNGLESHVVSYIVEIRSLFYMPRTKNWINWFCFSCDKDVKRAKFCSSCKEMTHYKCKKSGLSGLYSNYNRHLKSCLHCKEPSDTESRTKKEKRKYDELLSGNYSALVFASCF